MDRQIASNFNFLNGYFDELASIAKKAELLYSVDADSCAAKLRLFGEFWLYEYNRVSGNKIKLSGTFGDLIAKALNEKLIGEEHYDLLEPLRSYGNLVSHVRFSQMSQKASSGSITKAQLKSNFVAIMALADALVERSGLECARSSEWIEPVDLISALEYQNAIYDNPSSVLKIAKIKLAEFSKLPHSKKRAELESINAIIGDCEYWLMKACSVHAEQAEFETYLFYIGYYHPAALNIKKATSFKTHATNADGKGDVHFFLAKEDFNKQRFDDYRYYITHSIERGHLQALDHYLCHLCSREEWSDEYRKYLKIGLDKNHIPCLITHVVTKITGLQNATEEEIKPTYKEINRLLIKLRAMKSEAANFAEALSVALTSDGGFTSEHAKHLTNGARSLPDYCMASTVALYAMYNNSNFVYATKTLIEQALRESEGTVASGAVCFFAAMAIFDTWHRTGQVLVPGLATEKLISKSASLGYQLAIDLENDCNEKTYNPRVIKNKRGIRKQTKAKRKQSRKHK